MPLFIPLYIFAATTPYHTEREKDIFVVFTTIVVVVVVAGQTNIFRCRSYRSPVIAKQ